MQPMLLVNSIRINRTSYNRIGLITITAFVASVVVVDIAIAGDAAVCEIDDDDCVLVCVGVSLVGYTGDDHDDDEKREK
jgi:ethanolamine utilization microcompartment shell protein EutS